MTYNTELHDMAQYVDGREDETFFSIIEIEKRHHSIRFATAEKCSRLSRPPRRNEGKGLPQAAWINPQTEVSNLMESRNLCKSSGSSMTVGAVAALE